MAIAAAIALGIGAAGGISVSQSLGYSTFYVPCPTQPGIMAPRPVLEHSFSLDVGSIPRPWLHGTRRLACFQLAAIEC